MNPKGDAIKQLSLTFSGQIRGGKNNLIVLRNGMHIPRREWAVWRDAQVIFLKSQSKGVCFDAPCSVIVRYWAGDARRRDVPAIMDSMCHCLERAGVVKDDSLLINWDWIFMGLDRKNPKAEIVITELEARP